MEKKDTNQEIGQFSISPVLTECTKQAKSLLDNIVAYNKTLHEADSKSLDEMWEHLKEVVWSISDLTGREIHRPNFAISLDHDIKTETFTSRMNDDSISKLAQGFKELETQTDEHISIPPILIECVNHLKELRSKIDVYHNNLNGGQQIVNYQDACQHISDLGWDIADMISGEVFFKCTGCSFAVDTDEFVKIILEKEASNV